MINVECTWGEGPDVLVVGKDERILNLSDTVLEDRFTHGCQENWHLDLTVEGAKELAYGLLSKAREAEDLENGWNTHFMRHSNKEE